MFSIGGQELAHPFDGHGLVVSIAFRRGRAFMRSRFVRTEECAGPAQRSALAVQEVFEGCISCVLLFISRARACVDVCANLCVVPCCEHRR